jgi:hypothetical protein
MEKYKILILLNLVIRISLLFIIPLSMFGDGLQRYIPYSFRILNSELSFSEPPFVLLIWAGLSLFFSGTILEISWKLVPVLFLVGSLILLPKVYELLNVNENQKLIITSLLLFSTPSLLYGSGSLLMESTMLFFTFLLFLLVEKKENLNFRHYLSIALISALMLYTKQTGYFILAGFILYVLVKDNPKKNKTLTILSLCLGLLFFMPWFIKNILFSPSLFVSVPMREFAMANFKNFLLSSKLDIINQGYHFLWLIPLFDQVKSVTSIKVLALPYLCYYLLFFVSALFISVAIIAGAIKYRKEYKDYLFLMLPILVFVVFWSFFLGRYHDGGRYLFSFQIFFYLFAEKFIESIKKGRLKRIFYLMILIFVILSLVTSYATALRIKTKDIQIREISEIVKGDEYRILSNDNFVRVSLKFYSQKVIEMGLDIDENVKDANNKIFESKDYQLFFNGNIYYVNS